MHFQLSAASGVEIRQGATESYPFVNVVTVIQRGWVLVFRCSILSSIPFQQALENVFSPAIVHTKHSHAVPDTYRAIHPIFRIVASDNPS